jgi:hypothetical protein
MTCAVVKIRASISTAGIRGPVLRVTCPENPHM